MPIPTTAPKPGVYDADSYYGRNNRSFDNRNPFGGGITITGPFGGSATIGRGRPSAELPFGSGEAHIGTRGR